MTESNLKLLFKGLIPIILFVGGIAILISRITFYSIFLGLPVTIIGLGILINALDEIVSSAILPEAEITKCRICKKPTPVISGIAQEETICVKCRAKT